MLDAEVKDERLWSTTSFCFVETDTTVCRNDILASLLSFFYTVEMRWRGGVRRWRLRTVRVPLWEDRDRMTGRRIRGVGERDDPCDV